MNEVKANLFQFAPLMRCNASLALIYNRFNDDDVVDKPKCFVECSKPKPKSQPKPVHGRHKHKQNHSALFPHQTLFTPNKSGD